MLTATRYMYNHTKHSHTHSHTHTLARMHHNHNNRACVELVEFKLKPKRNDSVVTWSVVETVVASSSVRVLEKIIPVYNYACANAASRDWIVRPVPGALVCLLVFWYYHQSQFRS